MAAEILAQAAPDGRVRDLARAKINLCLHVVDRRADGRHGLESFVVFPEIGDALRAERSPIPTLTLDGPFARQLDDAADNLAMRALAALRAALAEPGSAALHLEKRLPAASGMGGGSADAAAVLRMLARLWGRTLDQAALSALALALGADVPVCLESAPCLMRGIGERLSPAPGFPEFWMVLVNPGVETPTGAVFAALERADNPPMTALPEHFGGLRGFIAWLSRQRNDLEPPARGLYPQIDAALSALRRAPDCLLARMTGSGATCFALFESDARAFAAAEAIRAQRPQWWVAHARVKAWRPLPMAEAAPG